MSEIAKNSQTEVELRQTRGELETRLLRSMIATIAVAVIVSALLAPWRFTSGLVLGGALAILNYRWLHTSVAAIFSVNTATEPPRAGISRYVLRYLVVTAIVFIPAYLNVVSLPATLAGLCAFVPALFLEAVREFYFAIINREESF